MVALFLCWAIQQCESKMQKAVIAKAESEYYICWKIWHHFFMEEER